MSAPAETCHNSMACAAMRPVASVIRTTSSIPGGGRFRLFVAMTGLCAASRKLQGYGSVSALKGGLMSDDRIFAKCAWRLIPFMVLLYVVSFIDRTNAGFAALTMNTDLGFSPAVFGFGAGIFFVGYALFQVPANLILERIGARRWVFCILAVWGLLSASNALVRSPTDFYAVRFLLGVAEAGFYPGMLLYLTYWFPHA
jgi:ACS family tartrate transporter-like MFS transporter